MALDEIQFQRLDSVDVLFVVDNSPGAGDNTAWLADAAGELTSRLATPPCIDDAALRGDAPSCSLGPQFQPITDVHMGVVTTSLGGLGSGACQASEAEDDGGHLLGTRPRAADIGLSDGFISWDSGSEERFAELLSRVGQEGCEFEAPLEAFYRFLVDPEPYERIEMQPCSAGLSSFCAIPVGRDDQLLAQRAAFLRSDSAVVVLAFGDENDCSLQAEGQFYNAARVDFAMPAASSYCAEDPNHACCFSCALGVPPGCAPDPACDSGTGSSYDPYSLRCFDQKRRFGVELVYPVERYENALTRPLLCPSRSDLNPEECLEQPVLNPFIQAGSARSVFTFPHRVFFAAITGAPWQDLSSSRSASGAALPADALRFRTAAELETDGIWEVILGQPRASPPVEPVDPLMIESVEARAGVQPTTGVSLAPPTAGPLANPINGHEHAIADALQYSCVTPFAEPRACSASAPGQSCPCQGVAAELAAGTYTAFDPRCHDPTTGVYGDVQHLTAAWPALRQLEVAQRVRKRGIVGSVCSRNSHDPALADFGLRPSMQAVVETVGAYLGEAGCLPRPLSVPTACKLYEVVPAPCSCDAGGRKDPDLDIMPSVRRRMQQLERCGAGLFDCDSLCVCELQQAGEACLSEPQSNEPGWCYIDAAQAVGDPRFVANCPPVSPRRIRFVGDEYPRADAVVLLSCLGALLPEETSDSVTPSAPLESEGL